jgi:hypothetical protein
MNLKPMLCSTQNCSVIVSSGLRILRYVLNELNRNNSANYRNLTITKKDAIRGWRLEAGSWKLVAGGWKLEDGGWKLEDGGWRLEAGGCRLEAGGWRLEAGGWKLEA